MPTSVRARTRLPTRSRGPSCGSPSRSSGVRPARASVAGAPATPRPGYPAGSLAGLTHSRACLVSGEVSGLPHALLSGDRSVHAPLALRGSPLLGTVSGELLPLLVGAQGLVEVSARLPPDEVRD